jgi:hypothetical protein
MNANIKILCLAGVQKPVVEFLAIELGAKEPKTITITCASVEDATDVAFTLGMLALNAYIERPMLDAPPVDSLTHWKLHLQLKLCEASDAGMLGVIAATSKVSEKVIRAWVKDVRMIPTPEECAALLRVCRLQGSNKDV